MSDGRLKISSKKLDSGNFQVNFTTFCEDTSYYGYLLAAPKTSIADVIEKIERHVHDAHRKERYFQRNLFSVGKRTINSGKILVFKK